MYAQFIIYEQDGKTGNDFVKGNAAPFKWLVEAKKKYPNSKIALKSFHQIIIPDNEFNYYNELIGIDQDNGCFAVEADNKAAEVEPVIKPALQKKTVKRKKAKKKRTVNGDSGKSSQGDNGEYDNPDE